MAASSIMLAAGMWALVCGSLAQDLPVAAPSPPFGWDRPQHRAIPATARQKRSRETVGDRFENRAARYLSLTRANSMSMIGDAARVHSGISNPIQSSEYDYALGRMQILGDTSDFNVPALMWLLLIYPGNLARYSPENSYNVSLRSRIKNTMLGWRYWIDEQGGAGEMHVWTENHAMNFHTAEYLVGSLYPGEVFNRTGLNGSQHARLGEEKAMRWLERRWKWGFSEWRSTTYTKFDIASVATLAALAPDIVVANKAARVLDLLLLDSAIHTFKGQHASSSGRILGYNIEYLDDPPQHEVLNYLIGGEGRVDSGDSHSVVAVALLASNETRWIPSNAILSIADEADELKFMVRERIGIGPNDTGLAYATDLTLQPKDFLVWMGLGCYTHHLVVPLIVQAANSYDLFSNSESSSSSIFDIWRFMQNMTTQEQANLLVSRIPFTYFGILGPAETVYWRSPNAALASVTDYMKAAIGDQQRVWRATLGNGTAAVYTTYPGPGLTAGSFVQLLTGASERDVNVDYDGNAASYWVGSASLPRIGQWDNALIVLYRPPPELYKVMGSSVFPFNYTHAAFPRKYFDEIVDDLGTHGRIAGRSGTGYVALWSASGNATMVQSGDNAGTEITSPTGPNGTAAWACIVGDYDTYGSFDNFVSTVLRNASIKVLDHTAMITTFEWGERSLYRNMSFGWDAPLLVYNGTGSATEERVNGYGRYESPFIQADFPAPDDLTVNYGGFEDTLSFSTGALTSIYVGTTSPTTSHPTPPTKAPTTPAPTTGSPTPRTRRPTTARPTTSAPVTRAPVTKRPTRSPISSRPTRSPTTKAPTSSRPTRSPHTSRPTRAPRTSRPSRSPTSSSPTTQWPTLSPMISTTPDPRASTAAAMMESPTIVAIVSVTVTLLVVIIGYGIWYRSKKTHRKGPSYGSIPLIPLDNNWDG